MPTSVQTTVEYTDNYGVTTPVGTSVFNVDEIGNVTLGNNELLPADWGSTPGAVPITADFVYSARVRSVYTRNLRLHEVGDPVDLAIGRTGPNGGRPNGSPPGTVTGLEKGDVIGRIYWQGWTSGNRWSAGTAGVYARTMEAYTSTKQGTQLHFATTPVGAIGMRDAMILTSEGKAMLRLYGGPPELGGNYPPNDGMFPSGLLSAGLMYWDDGHNKLWIRRGSGQWISVQLS